MRKPIKKILAFASAAVLACGACSFAACGTSFRNPDMIPGGDAVSNGGFVTAVGDYYYFINGKEVYTADNTYGTPVKGALMRAKKEGGVFGEAETVIPSLMVAGSYGGGIYIYGERVYYATPTNVKDIEGQVQSDYLDFMSAKLDGTDRKELVRVSSNATEYRFVEEGDTVYLVYYDTTATALHSYNTAKKTDTVLAEGLAAAPVFHKTDKESTAIYYTMTVTDLADSDDPKSYSNYNQIYRVSAGTTEAPYTYEWDQDWLDENNGGKAPYTNLGTLVLDGIAKEKTGSEYSDKTTQFNHGDRSKALSPVGFTYTLRSYENGGIYFIRNESSGDGKLYYLAESDITAAGWDSIEGNGKLQVVASNILAGGDSGSSTAKATANALYFIDKQGGHHYIYTDGKMIVRADVGQDGLIAKETKIAFNADGATLVALDPVEGDDAYGYVYYTLTVNGNLAVYRAVYDNKAGTIEQYYYNNLEDANFGQKSAYEERRILDITHATGWYNIELIGTDLFFADADSTAYGSSMNYVSRVSLANAEGKLMDNAELKAFDEKLNSVIGYDDALSADSLFADVAEKEGDNVLSDAMKYYFYTGDRKLLDENVKEYEDAIKENEDKDGDEEITNPYTEKILEAFTSYTEGAELSYNGNTYTLKDGEKLYNTRAYFVTELGKMSEADEEAYTSHWQTEGLSKYTPPAVEAHKGLAGWKIALIVIACVIAVCGAAAAVVIVLLEKKQQEGETKKPRMQVDTTDDKDIDVYADDTPQTDAIEETYEAPAEEETPAEEEQNSAEEAPAETEEGSDGDPYNE